MTSTTNQVQLTIFFNPGYRIYVDGRAKGMVAGTQTRALLEGLHSTSSYRYAEVPPCDEIKPYWWEPGFCLCDYDSVMVLPHSSCRLSVRAVSALGESADSNLVVVNPDSESDESKASSHSQDHDDSDKDQDSSEDQPCPDKAHNG